TVIKVERPEGDETRRWIPPRWNASSAVFHTMNRGKQSVRIDLADQKGKAQLMALICDADVFIHNVRPDAVAKLGLGFDGLSAANPRLIYCDISGFGYKGPKRLHPGAKPLVQAYTGLMESTGEPDRQPVRIGQPVCDFTAGMWAVIAILALLQK